MGERKLTGESLRLLLNALTASTGKSDDVGEHVAALREHIIGLERAIAYEADVGRQALARVKELEATALTVEEARAFCELVDSPTTFLHVHGWHYAHTAASRAAGAKLRATAGLPADDLTAAG